MLAQIASITSAYVLGHTLAFLFLYLSSHSAYVTMLCWGLLSINVCLFLGP